jgi:hypothetical protein
MDASIDDIWSRHGQPGVHDHPSVGTSSRAGVDDAGVAGGLQSTAVQLGGVMGTTILGSVLTSRVGSVLVGQLTHAIAEGSHAAFMTGLHSTMVVASAAAGIGALLALFATGGRDADLV